jgi:hypothetical protein
VSDEQRTHGGLSAKTLLIAGAASAAAALVIPMLWRPGTVFAAAMTPIVVALVSELLRRPVETVSSVRVRRTARGTAILDPPAPEEPFDPLAPPSAEELAVLPETAPPPRAVHRRRPLSARQWKLALATGLVAFVAVAAVFTASELVAGDAVSGGTGGTTFFGGAQRDRDRARERDERDAAAERDRRAEEAATPEATPEATATPAPTETPTAVQTVTPTPTPSPIPAEPAPAP